MKPSAEFPGLSTKEALKRLHDDIQQVLKQFETSQNTRKGKSWVRDALHHSSQNTTFTWISASLLLITSVCFLVTYCVNDFSHSWSLIYESLLILILLVLNIFIELYDNRLRHKEVPERIKRVLNLINREIEQIKWKIENYPKLCSPYSPCITMQWTYRDNKLVNLPWSLLVRGDVILIRPGQVSPGYCESLEKNTEFPLLHYKNIYSPTLQNANEVFSVPKTRKPLKNQKYRLLETPFLNNLHIALEHALGRPITQQNQQRHLVMIRIIERYVLPVAFFILYFVGLIKYIYLHNFIGMYSIWDLFILIPLKSILPLLPLGFTVAWNFLNYLGMARFKTLFDATTKLKIPLNHLEDDQEIVHLNHIAIKYELKDVLRNFLSIIKGTGDVMCRSANILHVLGSVTALCCVDKKGILSWPNPVAEKVFFLRDSDGVSQNSSLDNVGELSQDAEISHHACVDDSTSTVAEVLDMTHKHDDAFLLHFDDTDWKKHLNSLKPLGLAILLNTCNLDTQERYTEFCSHITCEAMYNENLIPVTNRRCLCALAQEIGFVEEAHKIFSLEQQLSTYRHLQPEMVRRDNKYARSLQLSTKLKFPFPHMFAVVVKELSSGAMQLLSEGTADIILDSCVEYWNGTDLCPITVSDRKKIQDFYQRSSLTAYCTAFAYRPLHKQVSGKLSDVYLELPSDSRHLYLSQRSPTLLHWEHRGILEPRMKPLGQFYSTDSLLYPDNSLTDTTESDGIFELQCNQVFIGMVTMQYQALADMVHLIEQLERACIRFVHFSKENELRSRVFSEKMGLESGWNCHISLLSERTRQEGGLQECWANNGTARVSSPINKKLRRKSQSVCCTLAPSSPTCVGNRLLLHENSHLESSRTMSFSAPSAINMDQPTVKFDTAHEYLLKNHTEHESGDNEHRNSQESMQFHTVDVTSVTHDWQSLSCLTDSTEHSAPINFDMSNRAKLPRGIDKIRPHIELIDNVPLLVSLFTDCTATVTQEMLHIMQEYGEVVCVIGSSANWENMGIFMQADASIAVEPLYPQVCRRENVFKPVDNDKCISPIDLARALNSVACSLSVKREDPISIYHLIMEARHYVLFLWSSVQFWLCCCFTLSFIQVLAAILLLPALLTVGQVLWFVCFIIPLLSISLMGLPVDPDVMKKPLGKNQISFNFQVLLFVLWSYGLKFLPLILTGLISFMGILSSHCMNFCELHKCTCKLFYLPVKDEAGAISGWLENSYTILLARNVVALITFVNFVFISVGFVHREHSIWQKSPHRNVLWSVTIVILSILQCCNTLLSFYNISSEFDDQKDFKLPIFVVIIASTSPVLTFIVNELIKHQEIQVNKRFRRRARLDFGTKLGMNSPF